MPRYLVQTHGCQMNVHDSRRMEEVLSADGYTETQDEASADLLVINTCSIREKAEHKLMSLLGTLRGLKAERRDVVIAVAGCVAQQEGTALLKKAPWVDVVIGPDNIPELPSLVRRIQGGGPPVARTVFDLDDPEFLVARPRPDAREVTAFVTVMKGCDEGCTYCIVPTTRGAERYRSAEDILSEIRGLVAGGVREVTLLGQTVNSWFEPDAEKGRPSEESRSEFGGLLRRIAAEVPELLRLRYTSPHPRHVNDTLVRAHAEVDVLPAHVHLPVQSGSDRVLRRMLRRYSRGEYIARAKALQASRPGFTLSTDIIVGFPGETEEDFLETLSLVREVGFVSCFGFKYSPRPGTPSLKFGDDVPEDVKDDRLARLFALTGAQQGDHLRSLEGREVTVLLEGPTKGDTGRWSGRTERHEIAHVASPARRELAGALVRARVTRANKHSLFADLEDVVLAPPDWRAPVSVPSPGPKRLPMAPPGAS